MHMHGLSSHILYKVNAHTMMSSQNLSVPDFMSSGKTPGVHPSRKELSHADKKWISVTDFPASRQ